MFNHQPDGHIRDGLLWSIVVFSDQIAHKNHVVLVPS